MKTFLTVLRQDLIVTRWHLLLWIAAIVVPAAATQDWIDQLPETQKLLLNLNYFGLVILALIIAGRVLFNHPARDDRSAWRMRPLSGAIVGLAKFAGLSAGLIVPLAGLWWRRVGAVAVPAKGSVLEILGGAILLMAMALLAFLYLGSLCRTSGNLLSVMVLGFFAGPLISMPLFDRGLGGASVSTTGVVLALVVYGGGFGALLLRQYQRPRTGQHLLGGCGLLALIVGVILAFPRPPQHTSAMSTERADLGKD